MNENLVTVKDFQRDVLDRSARLPVVVDFWAEWCGPCKVLGPVMERIAAGADGRWLLATVDTEKFPEIAARFGISSIPNVKLFIDGRVTDEFTGALPEYAIRQWLEKAVPGPSARMLAGAHKKLQAGDAGGAVAILKEVIAAEPENPDARVMLARVGVMEDPAESRRLIAGIEDPRLSDDMDLVETIARMHDLHADPGPLAPGVVRDEYLRAIGAFISGDPDAALVHFIAVIREDRYYDDDGARKACIAIFRMLGDEHDITLRHRRDFGSALYV